MVVWMNVLLYCVLSITFQKDSKNHVLALFGKWKKLSGAYVLESNPKYVNERMEEIIWQESLLSMCEYVIRGNKSHSGFLPAVPSDNFTVKHGL